MWSLCGISAGCRREDCALFPRPWIHSPDVKDEEFLLLQAALHNSVCVSIPTACEREPAQGALAQLVPLIPPQSQCGEGQEGQSLGLGQGWGADMKALGKQN